MKVLYLSSPFYFDMDLSLIQKLKEKTELLFLIDVPSYASKYTAFDISVKKNAGIYSASDYKELNQYSEFIDLKRTYIINRTSKKTYTLSNFLLQFQINEFLKKWNIDVIHVNGLLKPTFLWFLLVNKRSRILTVHDPFPHSGENSRKVQLIRKLNLRFFKNFILLNDTQKLEFANKEKIPLENIFISRLGAYTYLSLFNAKKTSSEEKKENSLLFFGRVSPYKGIEELCKAILIVKKTIPDVELIIAGSGRYWFDIEPYKAYKNFKFINRFITTEELVKLIHQTQLVVCPYKDATQSGVIMTAFGLNKPVIATNVGGLKEMVKHKYTGSLLEPNNVDALAKEIIHLLENPLLVKEMENNIKLENEKGENSWEIITNNLINHYKTIS
ncbi:glycosyltransferase family 4 protein [Shivajiella indica]|uniref:Glycosyltransferase family 4 protein n=1 Tax=Shivajiella indica TaxID=872115 RepID=A0ABW5BBM4_9BACT